jgi:hypothetical protein
MASSWWMTQGAATMGFLQHLASAVLSHTGALCLLHSNHTVQLCTGTACPFSAEAAKQLVSYCRNEGETFSSSPKLLKMTSLVNPLSEPWFIDT